VGADVLEEAARQLAAEGAARKAAEGRVAELQRQLAEREAAEASFRSAEGGGPEVDEAVPEEGAVEEGDGDSGDEAVRAAERWLSAPEQANRRPFGRVARRRRLQRARSEEGFLWRKVRRRWRGWRLSGASEKVLGWVKNGVPCYWKKGEPTPWNLGTSMEDATEDDCWLRAGKRVVSRLARSI
jgi:hypothetical protein